MPSIKQLIDAGVHFGHQTRKWNPKMRSYIYGERDHIHIIDLCQTKSALDKACAYLSDAAACKKNIVFVGTRPNFSDIIESEARLCGAHFISNRWLGGLLTNFETVRTGMTKLREFDRARETGEFFQHREKEQARLNRECQRLERSFGGLKRMRGKVDILFVSDPIRNALAIKEANDVGVMVVGIADTNCDPDGIDFVIPGNDDSFRSVKLITQTLAQAILGDEDGPDLHSSCVPRNPSPGFFGTEVSLTLADQD